MAKNPAPTKKDSPAIRTGKAPFNKPASDYAKPHDMKNNPVSGEIPFQEYASNKAADKAELKDPVPNGVSYAVTREPKTSGIKMRGAGAAERGFMSRGPQA
jgi:hypothetical protein